MLDTVPIDSYLSQRRGKTPQAVVCTGRGPEDVFVAWCVPWFGSSTVWIHGIYQTPVHSVCIWLS